MTLGNIFLLMLINKNSSGVDEISNKLLKAIGTELAKPLTIIINQCLLTGIFPDLLKIEVKLVKPLFKRGDAGQLNNYRPISLLPTFLKFLKELFTLNCTHILVRITFSVNNSMGLGRNTQLK